MADTLRYGVAEAARRIDLAKQHIGNHFPFSFATIPLKQDSRNMFLFPGNGERASGYQNQDHWFPGRINLLHQITLHTGQIQISQIIPFTTSTIAIIARQ